MSPLRAFAALVFIMTAGGCFAWAFADGPGDNEYVERAHELACHEACGRVFYEGGTHASFTSSSLGDECACRWDDDTYSFVPRRP